MSGRTVEIHRVHPQNTNIVSKRTIINVEQGDKIKDVKAKYLAESPKRDWIRIDLRYENRVLKDEDEVPPDKSTLTFESVIMTPEAKRRSIPTRTLLPPTLNLEENATTEFVADSERVFKSETARALVLKTTNNNNTKTEEGEEKKTRLPGRDLLCSYSIRTNGCVFRIVHRMEGDWTGDVFRVRLRENSAKITEKEVSNTRLRFNSKDKVWIERRQTIQTNGVTEIVHFTWTPVGDGT